MFFQLNLPSFGSTREGVLAIDESLKVRHNCFCSLADWRVCTVCACPVQIFTAKYDGIAEVSLPRIVTNRARASTECFPEEAGLRLYQNAPAFLLFGDLVFCLQLQFSIAVGVAAFRP